MKVDQYFLKIYEIKRKDQLLNLFMGTVSTVQIQDKIINI